MKNNCFYEESLFESCETGCESDEGNSAYFVKQAYTLQNILITNKGFAAKFSKIDSEYEISQSQSSSQSNDSNFSSQSHELIETNSAEIAEPKVVFRRMLNMISSTKLLEKLMK